MIRNCYETFDEAFGSILGRLLYAPDFECNPRGMGRVRESLAQTFVVNDPRSRVLSSPTRNASYGFGVGEFLWYWQGKDDLETMLYYNRRMGAFSDDGKTLNSAYGKLLRCLDSSLVSQWETVVRELAVDPDSRRAVMTIFRRSNLLGAVENGSKDVPCTLSLQFFIRDGALNLHTVMRSNDVMWGLTYDLFSFTLLQECMLLDLRRAYPDLKLGRYFHTAGSLHLYERHWGQAEKIISETKVQRSSMEPITSLEHLRWLCDDEHLLRTGSRDSIEIAKYTGGLRWMAAQLNDFRRKRDDERAA